MPGPVPVVRLGVLVALVAAGGAVGGGARAAAGLLLPTPGGVPVATLVVNLTGSLALGLLLARVPGPRLRAFAGTGLLGGWTTWSALAVETGRLGESAPLLGAGYLAASVAGGLLLASAGARLGARAGRAPC